MSDDLKIIHDAQERTRWTQSWWAVAIVALGVGGSLALTKLSWWYWLAVSVPTFVLGYLLKDKIANPFVRLDPNMGPSTVSYTHLTLPTKA